MESNELSVQVKNLMMLPYWTSIVNGLVLLAAVVLLLVSLFLLVRHSTAPGIKLTFVCTLLLVLQQIFDLAWLFNTENNEALATKLFLFSETILFSFLRGYVRLFQGCEVLGKNQTYLVNKSSMFRILGKVEKNQSNKSIQPDNSRGV